MEKKQQKFSYKQFFKGYQKGEAVEQKSAETEESLSFLPYRILKVLGESGKAITRLELSAKTGVDIVESHKIVLKMEKEGFLRIIPDKKTGNDTVELTSKGKTRFREL